MQTTMGRHRTKRRARVPFTWPRFTPRGPVEDFCSPSNMLKNFDYSGEDLRVPPMISHSEIGPLTRQLLKDLAERGEEYAMCTPHWARRKHVDKKVAFRKVERLYPVPQHIDIPQFLREMERGLEPRLKLKCCDGACQYEGHGFVA